MWKADLDNLIRYFRMLQCINSTTPKIDIKAVNRTTTIRVVLFLDPDDPDGRGGHVGDGIVVGVVVWPPLMLVFEMLVLAGVVVVRILFPVGVLVLVVEVEVAAVVAVVVVMRPVLPAGSRWYLRASKFITAAFAQVSSSFLHGGQVATLGNCGAPRLALM